MIQQTHHPLVTASVARSCSRLISGLVCFKTRPRQHPAASSGSPRCSKGSAIFFSDEVPQNFQRVWFSSPLMQYVKWAQRATSVWDRDSGKGNDFLKLLLPLVGVRVSIISLLVYKSFQESAWECAVIGDVEKACGRVRLCNSLDGSQSSRRC
jgi:hypothetical protein